MSVKNGAVPNEETKTAFTTLTIYFPDSGEKIKTIEFLEASAGVVSIVEKFGKVFAPVVNDMNGNIKKLKQKHGEDPESYQDLEAMILKEKVEGDMLATDALLWLRSDSERLSQDLTPFVKKAYSESLEPHHGWLGTQLFNVLSRFVPSRKHLFYTLALDRHHKDEQVLRDMRIYNEKMTACVVRCTLAWLRNCQQMETNFLKIAFLRLIAAKVAMFAIYFEILLAFMKYRKL